MALMEGLKEPGNNNNPLCSESVWRYGWSLEDSPRQVSRFDALILFLVEGLCLQKVEYVQRFSKGPQQVGFLQIACRSNIGLRMKKSLSLFG